MEEGHKEVKKNGWRRKVCVWEEQKKTWHLDKEGEK